MYMLHWLVLFLVIVVIAVLLAIRLRRAPAQPWYGKLEQDTMQNQSWRRVLATTDQLQVAAMSVPPGETLGWEVHNSSDQFFRVESGTAKISLANGDKQVQYTLTSGDAAIVPRNTHHNVYNLGREDLKLYTIYAPPHHAPTVHDRTHLDETKREG
jgi:mannose-6-phosphate isomerase-like protein (cupin superfamily)